MVLSPALISRLELNSVAFVKAPAKTKVGTIWFGLAWLGRDWIGLNWKKKKKKKKEKEEERKKKWRMDVNGISEGYLVCLTLWEEKKESNVCETYTWVLRLLSPE